MASWASGIKAVLFDFVGTLVSIVDQPEQELKTLYESLVSDGFNLTLQSFGDAYSKVYHAYRELRLREQREIGNRIWVADTLRALGFQVEPTDEAVIRAVDAFYRPFLESMQLYPCVEHTLLTLAGRFKLGLVTNFSYAPAARKALAELGIGSYFDAVTISEEVGWRKPSPRIFHEALQVLQVSSAVSVFVGDEPDDDVMGAANVGMKTILVLAPRESQAAVKASEMTRRPDLIVGSICEVPPLLLPVRTPRLC